MTTTLPLFASRGTVVFPNTVGILKVSRPSTFKAIDVSNKEYQKLIFLAVQKNKEIDDPSFEDFLTVGCVCRIESTFKNEKEDSFVRLEGLYRATLLNANKVNYPTSSDSEESFMLSEISQMKIPEYPSSFLKKEIEEYLGEERTSVYELNSVEMREISTMLSDPDVDAGIIVDKLSALWPEDIPGIDEFKKKLLSEINPSKNMKFIISQDALIASFKKTLGDKITKKVQRNISKQQKEFFLREKLKTIKEELGDAASKENEIFKLRDKINSKSYPKHVKEKALEEIRRLEFCSSYSNEATVIRSYLDWLLYLPWNKNSPDESDLAKVQKSLDKNHKGLEKIKERILEFIAVRNKLNKCKGSIICFVGPPGVGKTSLAKSIAKALNRQFVKISLGGLNDEAELRGHRKTYVASMPGKIIRSLRQAKVKNPVLLLDEIDKVSSSYSGDPVHALLEILDPQQNENFNDHYMEVDFDLSNVMFIATANYEENIPDPLLDRLEIIYLNSYTEKEKFEIAKSHLIAEALNESGLTPKELIFEDDAIMYIIQRYTKEAGVRNLKQKLLAISRKFVKKQQIEGIKKQKINIEKVREYLEYELYDFTKKDEEIMPGIVNGMAYTSCGGDLLPIEINYMLGKGNLSLTGNLKDIMRESANVALAYVRANEEKFKLKKESIDWNNIDINLHVPSGAVPKDGPSAGVTITTALLSAFLRKSVPSNVAMTGEITLRGKVLPIGGLKEKVISAVRGGVDTIFYPNENERNIVDIPEDIREKINLIPVKHYQEIYEYLFSK